ncbi:MAG: osmoprotectant transport system substrate-binding protein [Solirubrobacteraceae bacterium]|jgi:osmoprotectant transport system substrate-binding protein|nr:osmoprotectant transport system substrate-binding protein [Solirubrobacteraceae bacterium]
MPGTRWGRLRTVGGRIVALFAASALGVGLAACGSSSSTSSSSSSTSTSAAGEPGAGKPAVTIGDKNFPEENILGELYAQALQAKGYKITLKPNVGSSEIIYKALQSGRVQMYPEYTGVFLTAVVQQTALPKSAEDAYKQAKAFAESKGYTMLAYTPFFDSDALAVAPSFATQHKLASIADLKALGKGLTLGGAPEFATRFQGLVGLKKEYGVDPTFKPIAIELSYKALESNQVDAQDVFTTDGQLLGDKFKVLSDPKHVFGFQNVAPIVKKSVLSAEGPAFEETINKVSKLLTIPAIQQMNKAVTVEKQSATSVATRFLKANGLA